MTLAGDHQDVELGRLAAEIEAASAEAQRYRRKDWWTPYPKQAQFFATGLHFRERGLFAATQVGKSECASYECALHLTGEYPPDWPGRKFDNPVRAWAVGDSLKMVRDIQQKKLCGEPGSVEGFGSGMIPKDGSPAFPFSPAARPMRSTRSKCGTSRVAFRCCDFARTKPARWRCKARAWMSCGWTRSRATTRSIPNASRASVRPAAC
jgi:hypothetical protein